MDNDCLAAIALQWWKLNDQGINGKAEASDIDPDEIKDDLRADLVMLLDELKLLGSEAVAEIKYSELNVWAPSKRTNSKTMDPD